MEPDAGKGIPQGIYPDGFSTAVGTLKLNEKENST
jgi:hypothetical protein